MKNTLKKISFLVVLLLSIVITPNYDVFALSQETSFIETYKYENLNVGGVSFTNIKFRDYSKSSSLSFGLSGNINNSSNSTINYTASISYYDSSYNEIAKTTIKQSAIPGKSDLNLMSNLSILGTYTTEDIASYKLKIDTEEANSTDKNYSLTPSVNEIYRNNSYVIDKYDINVVVNEDNVLDITETITAFFNVEKHGIFRKIPLVNNVERKDGSKSTIRSEITNLDVDSEYTTSKEEGNFIVKIGSASETLTGSKTYKIKYSYNLGPDPVKDYDEIYYNLIGNEWDTVIGNITFTVTMPKEFDSSKLGFSAGYRGADSSDNIIYNVNGKTITGSYDGILGSSQALTLRCELDEGYFVGAGFKYSKTVYLLFLIPITFLIISVFIWHKYGKDNEVIETVEFYPPEGLNSLDVGYAYKGSANNQDVTSLLIYLASKGYLKISETESKGLLKSKQSFKLTKLKEYDGTNQNEKTFFEGLFKKKNEVTEDDLCDKFYTTVNKILINVRRRKNKYKIFEKAASSKTWIIVLMIIITFCAITLPPMLRFGDDVSLVFSVVFPGISLVCILFAIFPSESLIMGTNPKIARIATTIFLLFFALSFGFVPFIFIVLPALTMIDVYLYLYITGIISIFLMAVCLRFLPKRTVYGNEILGKIRGFKNFLETAEKDKLEAMVMENPTYFYDILPYTYVLGVSDKWIKKFETISMEAPDWYSGTGTFNVHSFGRFMDKTVSNANAAMTSMPASSGGGSFGGGSSGGGFSGGGSGGGGGGSW